MINPKLLLFFFFWLNGLPSLIGQTEKEDLSTATELLAAAKKYPEETVDSYQKAMSIYQKWEKWEAFFLTQQKLADFYRKTDEYEKSEATYLDVLDKMPASGLEMPHIYEAEVAQSLGDLYRRFLHQPYKAEKFMKEGVDWYIANGKGESKESIDAYGDLGLLYLFEMNNHQQAMDHFLKAVSISIKHFSEKHLKTADLYNKIATTYRYQRNPKQALVYFGKASAVVDKKPSPKPDLLQSTYNNMGATYADLGEYSKAILYFQKAINAQKEYGLPFDRNAIMSYINIGDCNALQGLNEEALVYYKDAYQLLFEKYGAKNLGLAGLCNNIVVSFFRLNQPDSALLYSHKALLANAVGFDDPNVEKTPGLEGLHYLDGTNLLFAYGNKASALEVLFETTHDFRYLELAHEVLVPTFQLFERLEADAKTSGDKMYLYSLMQEFFRMGIQINAKLYQETGKVAYKEEAFAFSETNKGALLRQSMQEGNAQQFGGIPDSLLQLELEIKQQLATYENQWVKAEVSQNKKETLAIGEKMFEERKRYQELQRHFEEEYAAYYALKYEEEKPNVAAIQALVPLDAALLSYFWEGNNLISFVLQRDSFWIVEQHLPHLKIQSDSLFLLLYSSRSASENTELYAELYSDYAHGLYQDLIGSLSLPATLKKLIIIPDGSLYYIPFEALLKSPVENKKAMESWDYLLRHYTIHYSYSGDLFAELSERKMTAANNKMLAFAPSYKKEKIVGAQRSPSQQKIREHLIELAGAQKEVKQLEKIFQGDFWYGADANERKFKDMAADFGILHFAMHGLMDSKAPTNSSLAFTETGDSLEDNFMHAYEINHLQLNAQLVVLSACETGHGKFESGEGVMSLARSFMYAGANSVMATLWQVNDASTAMLIEYFYENLAKNMDKAEALRQAKLRYLQTVKGLAGHPTFWAAPILIGDDRPLTIQSKWNTYWMAGIGLFLLVGLGLLVKKKVLA